MACGGYMDHLSAQGIDKRIIFPFRISDNDVVLSDKKSIRNLPLCREGFSGARCPKNQSVRSFVKRNFFRGGKKSAKCACRRLEAVSGGRWYKTLATLEMGL